MGFLKISPLCIFINLINKIEKRKEKEKKCRRNVAMENDYSGISESCIIVLSLKCINIFFGSKVETNLCLRKITYLL